MKYDVVVVGAGPAGSTAAKFLSEKGIKVLLLDKCKFPRDKPCGGGIPIGILKDFKYIEEKGLIESYSYGGCFHSSLVKYKVELLKNIPLIAMVLRKKFDYGLVKIAIDSGATFMEGKTFEDIKIFNNKVRIKAKDGTAIDSEIVIGADGVWSTVAKRSGLSQNLKNFGIALVQEYPISSEIIDQYFTEKRIGHIHMQFQGIAGYGWVGPLKKHLNIGIGEFERSRTNLKDLFKYYIEFLKENKIIPENIKMGRVKGAAIPNRPVDKTYADRILLCGDAGGLVNPFSGEGIDYAMSSGKIAANVIVEALEIGDTSANFLSKYEKTWKKDFGKDIKLMLRFQKKWRNHSINLKMIKLVSRDKKLSEIVVEAITGNRRVHEIKFKVAGRLLFLYIRDLLHKT